MADFAPAFEKMIHDEGGYQLTDIPGDRGGQTYAGIARKPNPDEVPSNYQFIGTNTILSQTSLPTNYDFYFVNSNNVVHYSAFTLTQGAELYVGQDLPYFPMSTDVGLKIVIQKESGRTSEDSNILFNVKLV